MNYLLNAYENAKNKHWQVGLLEIKTNNLKSITCKMFRSRPIRLIERGILGLHAREANDSDFYTMSASDATFMARTLCL